MNKKQANKFVKWIEEVRVVKNKYWDLSTFRSSILDKHGIATGEYTYCAAGLLTLIFKEFSFNDFSSPTIGRSYNVNRSLERFFGLSSEDASELWVPKIGSQSTWCKLATKILGKYGYESVAS